MSVKNERRDVGKSMGALVQLVGVALQRDIAFIYSSGRPAPVKLGWAARRGVTGRHGENGTYYY